MSNKANSSKRCDERKRTASAKLQDLAATLAQAGKAFDPILDVFMAAVYTGRHEQTLREAVRQRELACCRTGTRGHMRFRLSHLNAWLARQEQRAARVAG
ncbi:MAG: hypothetical protein AMXMBFR33_56140 [Candidatus Xenobia bacterium]